MDRSQSVTSSTECTTNFECSELQTPISPNEIMTSVTESPTMTQPPDADRASEFTGVAVPFQNHPIEQATTVGQEQGSSIDIEKSVVISVEMTLSKNSNKTGARSKGKKKAMQTPLNLDNILELPSRNRLNLPEGSTTFSYETEVLSIEIKDLCEIKNLGHGSFGRVFSIVLKGTADIPIAIKCVPFEKMAESEITIMTDIATGSCPYIIDYYCALVHPTDCSLYICMEFMDTSVDAFYKAIHEQRKLQLNKLDQLVHRIGHDIASALDYMRNKEVVHRDIKPENMLINRKAVVKLCDFGISRTFDRLRMYSAEIGDIEHVMLSPLIHTQNYMPPRVKGCIQDDMWSLGISLLEVISGQNPFADWKSSGRCFALKNWEPSIPDIVSADMQKLILCLLEKEDRNRPASYVEILENPPICNVPVMSSSDECQFVCYIIDNFLQTNTSSSMNSEPS